MKNKHRGLISSRAPVAILYVYRNVYHLISYDHSSLHDKPTSYISTKCPNIESGHHSTTRVVVATMA
jgi:hypothetical protein